MTQVDSILATLLNMSSVARFPIMQVEEGDYSGLVKVMEFLRMVKEKQATADVMFEPLRGIINMLRLDDL